MKGLALVANNGGIPIKNTNSSMDRSACDGWLWSDSVLTFRAEKAAAAPNPVSLKPSAFGSRLSVPSKTRAKPAISLQ
jgi:hypothetical protein